MHLFTWVFSTNYLLNKSDIGHSDRSSEIQINFDKTLENKKYSIGINRKNVIKTKKISINFSSWVICLILKFWLKQKNVRFNFFFNICFTSIYLKFLFNIEHILPDFLKLLIIITRFLLLNNKYTNILMIPLKTSMKHSKTLDIIFISIVLPFLSNPMIFLNMCTFLKLLKILIIRKKEWTCFLFKFKF